MSDQTNLPATKFPVTVHVRLVHQILEGFAIYIHPWTGHVRSVNFALLSLGAPDLSSAQDQIPEIFWTCPVPYWTCPGL
jgi:hypothetical protein